MEKTVSATLSQAFRRVEDAPSLGLIGDTPLLRIKLFEKKFPNVEVYAKAEWFNPGGSVKDRPALYMVRDGIERGIFQPGMTLLDSTSGNTGIAYAMIGATLGFPVKLVLPENASPERKATLVAYGAELVFSDPLKGSDGAQWMAHRIYESDPENYFLPVQYDNPANVRAHTETTAMEIMKQTEGRVEHFVAVMGTTGTLVGTGRGLKQKKPGLKVYGVMPSESFHGLEGMKHIPTSIRPRIYDESVQDDLILADTEASYGIVDRLALEEGIFVGHSSGAAMVGVCEVARRIKKGVVVTVFPDGGDRYISGRR